MDAGTFRQRLLSFFHRYFRFAMHLINGQIYLKSEILILFLHILINFNINTRVNRFKKENTILLLSMY